MNWETFKKLSKEEREEYQYKFNDKPDSGFGYLLVSIVGVGLVYFHLFLFYVISISTNETLLQYKDVIGSVIREDLKILVVFMWIMVLALLYNAINNIIYQTKRRRWIKKHNIKLHWWRDSWK
jgi:succinate dehydrogenase/fumarate reductase cytochrome b subunit